MPQDYAPDAIKDGFKYLVDLDADMDGDGDYDNADRLVLGGVLGDDDHYREGGYHVPAHACPRGDYSIEQSYDRGKGVDPYAASALDITPKSKAALIEINRRLIAAVKRNDPRLYPLREFFGPDAGGNRVTGRDVPSGRVVTSDSSHLWHEHLSFKRKYANDAKAIRGVMDVIAGIPLASDPLEEIMSFYANKDDFEAALARIVREQTTPQSNRLYNWINTFRKQSVAQQGVISQQIRDMDAKGGS